MAFSTCHFFALSESTSSLNPHKKKMWHASEHLKYFTMLLVSTNQFWRSMQRDIMIHATHWQIWLCHDVMIMLMKPGLAFQEQL